MFETSSPSTMKSQIFYQVSFITNAAHLFAITIPNRPISKKHFLDKLNSLVDLNLLSFRNIFLKNIIKIFQECNTYVLSNSRLFSIIIIGLEMYKVITIQNDVQHFIKVKFLHASEHQEVIQNPNKQPYYNLQTVLPFSSLHSAFHGRNKFSQVMKRFWNDANMELS